MQPESMGARRKPVGSKRSFIRILKKRRKEMRKLLSVFAMVAVLLIAGCGTFLNVKPTTQDVSNSKLAVQDAAIIVAIQKPEWVPEMVKVSDAVVKGLNAGSILTLADVQAVINQEAINMHYSEKTIAYANLFMINITAVIQQKGEISLTVPVQLCLVAQWINNAIGGAAVCDKPLVTAPTPT